MPHPRAPTLTLDSIGLKRNKERAHSYHHQFSGLSYMDMTLVIGLGVPAVTAVVGCAYKDPDLFEELVRPAIIAVAASYMSCMGFLLGTEVMKQSAIQAVKDAIQAAHVQNFPINTFRVNDYSDFFWEWLALNFGLMFLIFIAHQIKEAAKRSRAAKG